MHPWTYIYLDLVRIYRKTRGKHEAVLYGGVCTNEDSVSNVCFELLHGSVAARAFVMSPVISRGLYTRIRSAWLYKICLC